MLGVIPAAGRATRFGGVFKELLPIGDGDYLLLNALRQARALGADELAVVTRPDKADTHHRFLKSHDETRPVLLTQQDDADLWGAIRTTFPLRSDSVLVMPDTVFSRYESIPEGCDLAFGTFLTDEPERFSVLYEERIRTKLPPARPGQRHWMAWGSVYWSARVVEFWRAAHYEHYDRAFEDAMRVFGWQQFAIAGYQDLGTWDSYSRFVKEAR